MAMTTRVQSDVRYEPSLSDTLRRVRRSASDLVEDHVELWKLEVRDAGQRAGRGAGFFAAAGFLAVLAWIGLSAAAAIALARVTSPALAVAGVALANAGLAAGLAVAGRRALRGSADPPD
jgi:hypothetical protein